MKGKNENWVHVSCALWLTGPKFEKVESLTPVYGIEEIDGERYELKCIFCKRKKGACLQCELCLNSYHVPCAARGTATLELREDKDPSKDLIYYHNFCPKHSDDISRAKVPDDNSKEKYNNKKNKEKKRRESGKKEREKRNLIERASTDVFAKK